jgi:hypothetical protein
VQLGRVALASSLFLAQPVRAQEGGVDLEYVGPEGCSSKAEVMQRFIAALGPDRGTDAALQAKMVVEPLGGHYLLRYSANAGGRRTTRTLEAESCRAVTEAAALFLLLSVDPTLASTLDAPGSALGGPSPGSTTELGSAGSASPVAASGGLQSSPKSAPAATVQPALSAIKARPPKRHSRSLQLGGFLGANLEASSSLAPSWAVGGSLEAGARVGMMWIGVRGGLESTPSSTSVGSPNIEVTALLGRVHGWVGGFVPVGRFRMGPYVGAGVEVLQLWASGLASGGSGSSPFLSGRAGGRLLWLLDPSFALGLDVGLTVPFERPAFVVTGVESPVHRPGAISADAAFGLNWLFGSQ